MIIASLRKTIISCLPLWLMAGLAGAQPQDFPREESCMLSLNAQPLLAWRGPFSRGYDSASGTVHGEKAVIDIRNRGGACDYFLEIKPDAGNYRLASGHGFLDFSLRTQGGPSTDTGAFILEGRAARSGGGQFNAFLIDIPAGQKAGAGTYEGELILSLYQDRDGAMMLADTSRIRVRVEVWPRVVAAIGADPASGRKDARIDLGLLRPGASALMEFSVAANTAYTITVHSDHGGALRHDRSPALLDYELFLGTARLELNSAEGAVIRGSGETSRQHGLQLRLSDFKTAPAGHYSDQLILTISAE